MPKYALVEAPSVLGLFPRGVERLPEALLDAGLSDAIGARRAGRVEPPAYDPERDPVTGVLNPTGLRNYSHQLADATAETLEQGEFPVVLGGDCSILLGGDCSILLGNLLALRRRGRYGLLFLDGHADFYQPEAEPNGEVASMDLAIATGRGPEMIANLDRLGPLVRYEDVVHVGQRDAKDAEAAGSQRIEETDIAVIDLDAVRARGIERVGHKAIDRLRRPELDGFWIHVDCDVLDDAVMPAVDYRLPGGLSFDELAAVLRTAIESGDAVGIEVTIFNPALDTDGSIARALVSCLARGLRPDASRTSDGHGARR